MLVPFAVALAPASRQALQGVALSNLQKLLARLEPVEQDDGTEADLSMPHERALARARGLPASDGCIPWAALQAVEAGLDPGGGAWAFVTPCHWQVGTHHVAMGHTRHLQLDAADSQQLLRDMQPWFEQDGIELAYDGPTLWLARGEAFRDQPTASLDRVVGRAIDPWLPRGGKAGALRRLQQEMQMLLYNHPVNDTRAGAGLLPVNSFWVSGTGALAAGGGPAAPAGLQVKDELREAALQGDWAGWADAWRQLDATELTRLIAQLDRGEAVRITLCGERGFRTWAASGGGWWKRLAGAFSRQPVVQQLEGL